MLIYNNIIPMEPFEILTSQWCQCSCSAVKRNFLLFYHFFFFIFRFFLQVKEESLETEISKQHSILAFHFNGLMQKS